MLSIESARFNTTAMVTVALFAMRAFRNIGWKIGSVTCLAIGQNRRGHAQHTVQSARLVYEKLDYTYLFEDIVYA